MKTTFCQVVGRAIRHLAYQTSATHTVQQILNDLQPALNIDYSVFLAICRQDQTLEIKHFCNLFQESVQSYQKPLGDGIFFRILHLDHYLEITKPANPMEYEDLKIEGDFGKAIALRISLNHRAIGCFILYFRDSREIDPETREFLTSLCLISSEAFAKEASAKELRNLRRQEQNTGLLTYTFFLQKLREEIKKCERYNFPLTMAIMEIDNFDEVAALYGGEIAREMFVELADRLKDCVRGIDVMGHYGSNEFILFLPHTTVENADIVIQRFRQVMLNSVFTSKGLGASLSMGMSQFKPGVPLENIFCQSQAALHNARMCGKGPLKFAALNS